MKTLEEQAADYAKKYPLEIRRDIERAWLSGRRSVRKKEKAKLDLSFVEEQFMEIFEYWLNYKKERGQKYTQRSAESCYRKLLRLCGGDRATMIAVIEESVSNNWAGLFELKNNEGNYQSKQRREVPNIFSTVD